MTTAPRLHVGQLSVVGRGRAENQDRIRFVEPVDPAALDRKGRLLVVVDGRGPARVGGEAAELVATHLVERYYGDRDPSVADSLVGAVRAARGELERQARAAGWRAVGVAILAAAIVGPDLFIAGVGRTRWLLIRPTPDGHPADSSVIAHHVGSSRLDLTRLEGQVRPGDRIVLGSDGLDAIEPGEVAVIAARLEPGSAADTLVRRSLQRGANDDVSVLVAGVEASDPVASRPPAGAAAPPVRSAVSRARTRAPAPPGGPAPLADEGAGGTPAALARLRAIWSSRRRTVLVVGIVLALLLLPGAIWEIVGESAPAGAGPNAPVETPLVVQARATPSTGGLLANAPAAPPAPIVPVASPTPPAPGVTAAAPTIGAGAASASGRPNGGSGPNQVVPTVGAEGASARAPSSQLAPTDTSGPTSAPAEVDASAPTAASAPTVAPAPTETPVAINAPAPTGSSSAPSPSAEGAGPSPTSALASAPSPSATPAPSSPTPLPTPTASPTSVPVPVLTAPDTPTPAPTRPPRPRATAPRAAPAPVIHRPVNLGGAVLLSWSYPDALAPDEYFDVRVWSSGQPPAGIANVKATSYLIGGSFPPGTYSWTIAVIRRGARVVTVSAASETSTFTWAGVSSGGGGGCNRATNLRCG